MSGWALNSHGTDVLLLDSLYWCGGTNTVGKVYSAWHGYVDGMFAQYYDENTGKMRFGLEDGRSRTLEEVGKEFNVTRERIRQIEAKALRKLRHPSRSKRLKDYLD